MTWTGPNEPVRRNGLRAAVIVSLSTLFGGLGVGLSALDPVTTIGVVIAVCASLGAAFAQLGVILGYTNAGRNEAIGPRTHEDELVDAVSHAVQHFDPR